MNERDPKKTRPHEPKGNLERDPDDWVIQQHLESFLEHAHEISGKRLPGLHRFVSPHR